MPSYASQLAFTAVGGDAYACEPEPDVDSPEAISDSQMKG